MVNPIISKAFNKNRENLVGKAVLKRFLYRLDTQLFEKFVAAIAIVVGCVTQRAFLLLMMMNL